MFYQALGKISINTYGQSLVEITNDIDSCEYWGCTECEAINYNENATNCNDGSLDSCCNYTDSWDGLLSLDENEDGSYSILMQNNTEIGGFQIDISGGVIINASNGSATDAGFMISYSNSTVLGFSITGATIPQSNDISPLKTLAHFNQSKASETKMIDKDRQQNLEQEDPKKSVKSPIVGTAYLAPEPGAKKFIDVGKKIKKGDTIMIVEAMKTMNHIPSSQDGVVKKICVEDGQPVEFGQNLIIFE